MAHYGADQV